MNWFAWVALALAVLAGGAFFLRHAWRRRRARREKRRQFRGSLRGIRQAVEAFEKAKDFDEQIHLLADIVRSCSQGLRFLPEQAAIMNIARHCDDERLKLAQHWAVTESARLMALTEESANLRSKIGRADQVVESLKVISRLLFPHERITDAMHAVTRYQEALEGAVELPDDQRAEVAEGARTLLEPYFRIVAELRSENEE
ncbi:MAG: hypothetical protein ACE5IP_11565, partial [Terriglobia bacterium]